MGSKGMLASVNPRTLNPFCMPEAKPFGHECLESTGLSLRSLNQITRMGI